MTSEATAKLISDSGLAATELRPFAASAAIGERATLRQRIESLERVPALAEFSRDAISAIDGSASPTRAEHVARSLENLQAAATALLRHLHRSDALQSIGSEHAIWVKLPTGLPLAAFSDCVARLNRALSTLAALQKAGAAPTVEAADAGPLCLRVGFESGSACALTASACWSAMAIRRALVANAGTRAGSVDDGLPAAADREAHRIASECFEAATYPATVRSVAEVLSALAGLLADGVEFRQVSRAQGESPY